MMSTARGIFEHLRSDCFDLHPEEIEKRNRDIIVKFIIVGFLASVANLVADLVAGQFNLLGQVYVLIALFVVYAILYRLVVRKMNSHLRAVSYMMLALPLAAGIYIGTFSSPNMQTFTFAVLLCIASVFIFDKPWRAMFFIVATCIVYGVCCYLAKDHTLFMYDMSHLFIYAPLSMGTSLFVIDVRIREVEQTMMLRRKSEHDALTDTYNRNGGNPRIVDMLASGTTGALMFIDIDDFKFINDRYGHAAGDRLLKAVSDAISTVFGNGDIVMRVGGDEFVVFEPGLVDEQVALDKVMLMQDKISKVSIVLEDGDTTQRVTASVGVALSTGPCDDYDHLLRIADRMLYAVKDSDKGRCRVQVL
jgi:diguanylate cyclase (GGDEF)-like protein